MKNIRILSILLVLLLCRELYAANKIILVEEAKRVSEQDIRTASRSESEENADGGYNAHVNVVVFIWGTFLATEVVLFAEIR